MSDVQRSFPERYLLALGSVTLSWAMSELALNNIVGLVFHAHGGHRSEKDIPRTAYNRKEKYVRRAFSENDNLAQFAPLLIPILDEMNRLSEERHWCIHGVALNLHSATDSVTHTKYDVINNLYRENAREFDLEDMSRLVEDIVALSQRLADFLLHWCAHDSVIERASRGLDRPLHIALKNPPKEKT